MLLKLLNQQLLIISSMIFTLISIGKLIILM
nr:MAG TPA: hypothetical protein [Crassvirales sp.]